MITSATVVRPEGGFPRVRVRTMCIGMLAAMELSLFKIKSTPATGRYSRIG